MKYDLIQNVVRTPVHVVLFTITAESINENLQLQPSQSLTLFPLEIC